MQPVHTGSGEATRHRYRGITRPWRWRIGAPLVALVIFIVISSTGYRLIEKSYSWLDAFYMTVITVTTVGFQEVHPLSEAGKLWTMLVVVSGLVTGAVAMSMVVGMVVEGQIRTIFGRRQLQRKIVALNGHVIIAGYGHMAAMVAAELATAGRDVVVIDSDPQRTSAAEAAGLLYVLGDAQEEAVLAAAGVARAATLVAMMPTDAENVFVTLTARQANRQMRIIARAQQTSTQDKLTAAGASRVVCPQTLGAMSMADIVLRPAVVDFVEMAHKGIELEMDQLVLTEQSNLCNKTLRELALPRRVGVQVVAVRRADGQAVYQPTPDLRLASGDTLVLIGKKGVAAAVQDMQQHGDWDGNWPS
jgi:voltage-gated potassium channel